MDQFIYIMCMSTNDESRKRAAAMGKSIEMKLRNELVTSENNLPSPWHF
jgi:hypothetical protein